MSERIFYCICEDNCKFETLNREQILAAIAEAVETGEIHDVDTGFVTTIKDQNRGIAFKVWVGTTAEYNALPSVDRATTLYLITDDDTYSDLVAAIEKIISGETVVHSAENAVNAVNAENAEKTSFSNGEFQSTVLSSSAFTFENGTYHIVNSTSDFGIVLVDGTERTSSVERVTPYLDGSGVVKTINMLTISSSGKPSLFYIMSRILNDKTETILNFGEITSGNLYYKRIK